MMNNIPNLYFSKDFMKMGPSIGKMQMFKFSFLCKYSEELYKRPMQHVYSFTLISCYFKWRSCSFRQNKLFPILMAEMLFSQSQQAPKGRKIPGINLLDFFSVFYFCLNTNFPIVATPSHFFLEEDMFSEEFVRIDCCQSGSLAIAFVV